MVEVNLTGSGVIRTILGWTEGGPESRALAGTACSLAASRHLKGVEFSFIQVLRLHLKGVVRVAAGDVARVVGEGEGVVKEIHRGGGWGVS